MHSRDKIGCMAGVKLGLLKLTSANTKRGECRRVYAMSQGCCGRLKLSERRGQLRT